MAKTAHEIHAKIQAAGLDPAKMPSHVAIIMDGNGRWARKKGNLRVFGHQNAIQSVRDAAEGASELGIQYLTLYTFSTENWNRPRLEVDALMQLLVSTLRKEVANLKQHNIRLHAIGELHALPDRCLAELCHSIESTAHNTGLTLTLALSYGSRQDILQATKTLCLQAQKGLIDPNAITPAHFASALSTHGMPDPELLIRTSGEFRISNFLLWEIAYAELYVTDTLWPDFRKVHLYEALADYQRRERRFGKTSEQIQTEFTK